MKMNKWFKYFILFGAIYFYISIVSIYYFQITKEKDTAYVNSIWAKGISYIIPPDHELEFGDSDAYNKLAYSLITRGDFYNPANQISAWVTPGYPLFLAGIYIIFGYSFLAVIIVQTLLLTSSFILIFSLSRRLYNQTVAYIVLAILLLSLRLIVYVPQVYTEILFIFFISVILFSYFKLIGNDKYSYAWSILTGFAMGFGFLVRPVIMPVLIIIPIFLLINHKSFRYIVICSLVAILIISIWLYRNYKVFNRLLISTNSEMTLTPGFINIDQFNFFEPYSLVPFAEKNLPPDDPEFINKINVFKSQLPGDIVNIPYPQGYIFEPISHIFKTRYDNYKLEKPLHYFIRSAYLFKVLLLPYSEDMSARNKIMSTLIWLITFFPFFMSLFLLPKNRNYWFLTILGISFLIAPSLNIVDTNLRYQLPSQFVITILSGQTLYFAWGKVKCRFWITNKSRIH